MKTDNKYQIKDTNYIQSIYKIVLYIEQHYQDEISLDELASIAGFSKYHFHRLFKSIVGENIGDYITRVKLSSSTMRFLNDNQITEIAMDSGYETNASFSKAFKRHFSMTPSEFAKSIKKKRRKNNAKTKICRTKRFRSIICEKNWGL